MDFQAFSSFLRASPLAPLFKEVLLVKRLGRLRNTFHLKGLLALVGVTLLLAEGCATPRIPLSYSPSSSATVAGSVKVSAFKYLPAETKNVEPYQIRNTALGSVMFDQNIDVFFRDAVFKEFRFVGIKVDDKTREVGGEIVDFLIDDLGFSVDWKLNVHYVVKDLQSGTVLYDANKETKRKTAKFLNFFASLNETIKSNIDELFKDESFINAIKSTP